MQTKPVHPVKNPPARRPQRVAPATENIHPDSLIRLHQILGLNGAPPLLACGRTQFYAWVKEGRLPPPRKVGHVSFWRAGDILEALQRLGA
jgi:predicted DNA-binding transcriptional regulator AlpA